MAFSKKSWDKEKHKMCPQTRRAAGGANPELSPPRQGPRMLQLLSEQQQLLGSFSWQGSSALHLSDSSVCSQPSCTQQHVWSCPREKAAARDHQARKNSPILLLIPTVNHSRMAQDTLQPNASCAPTCSLLEECVGIRSWSLVLGWAWGFVCAQGTAGTLTPSGGGNSIFHIHSPYSILLLGCSVALRCQGKPPWHWGKARSWSDTKKPF